MDQVRGGKAPRRSVILCLIFGFGAFVPFLCQAAEESLEYSVKAAFLFNFTKYIEWPPEAFARPDAPLEICVFGSDPFGETLDQTVAGESVNGHKVVVHRVSRSPVPKSCHVVFFGAVEKGDHNVLPELGRGVLTVGEGEPFLGEGGMIAFVIENRRVRFAINQAAAAGAGLRLSSQLLKVAKSVER